MSIPPLVPMLPAQVALALSFGEGVAARLRARLFSRLLSRDAPFHDAHQTGTLTSWLGQDVELLQSTIAKLLGARGVRAAFETVGIIAMLVSLSWPLAVALLATAPLLTPLIASLSSKITVAARDSQVSTWEVCVGMRVVCVCSARAREVGAAWNWSSRSIYAHRPQVYGNCQTRHLTLALIFTGCRR
jgi:ABC-type multidrug transport system fused ATPase/permease subunit